MHFGWLVLMLCNTEGLPLLLPLAVDTTASQTEGLPLLPPLEVDTFFPGSNPDGVAFIDPSGG